MGSNTPKKNVKNFNCHGLLIEGLILNIYKFNINLRIVIEIVNKHVYSYKTLFMIYTDNLPFCQ